MAFINVPYEPRVSDLLIDHMEGGFNFQGANITPAGVIKIGTVVFRAKGIDPVAPYAAVTAASLVATNEFAVVYGDHFSYNYSFTPKAIAAGLWNSLVIDKGPAMFKEFYIKQVQSALTKPQFEVLRLLLKNQGLVVIEDINAK